MTITRYQPVDRKTAQVGCGTRFSELLTYILDTQTGKLVRDIGAMVAKEEAADAYSTSYLAHRNDWSFEEYCERMGA